MKSIKKTNITSPLPKETYEKNARLYKILANPKRLEILNILKQNDTSVEKLLTLTKLPKANLSQHMAVMRHCGLVVSHRKGLNITYSIVDPRIVAACGILQQLRSLDLVR
ncbi:MAG: metalloregulator ArsR/SmtB family transcription factor [Candidatus Paceibacterota bacterium]|jgi:ArsR family transcriptional regulator